MQQCAGHTGRGEALALVGDSSGGTFVAAVAAMAHDDGFDGITHQVLYYPSLDLDFDGDRYASLRENAVGYGLETAGLAPFNAFYLDSGADPADPLVSPIKRADLSGLPPPSSSPPSTTRFAMRGSSTVGRLREAGVDATVSRYAGAGHGFVQHFSWLPELHRAFEETAALHPRGPSMSVDVHPLASPWGRFHLYSFYIDAPEPAIVDTGIASSPAEGMAPRPRRARPPDRGRAMDPAHPRPHRPRGRGARPVGADRPSGAGRHPRGRRTDAALAAGPRRGVCRWARALPARP